MWNKLKDRVIALEERSRNNRRMINDAVERTVDNGETVVDASSEANAARRRADVACGGVFKLAGKLKNHSHPEHAFLVEVNELQEQLTALHKKSVKGHEHPAYEGAHTRINDIQIQLAAHDEKFVNHGETLYRHKKNMGRLFQKVSIIEERMVIQQVEQEAITGILTEYKDRIIALEGALERAGSVIKTVNGARRHNEERIDKLEKQVNRIDGIATQTAQVEMNANRASDIAMHNASRLNGVGKHIDVLEERMSKLEPNDD